MKAMKSTKTSSKEIIALINAGGISPLRRARLIHILNNEHNMSQDEIGALISMKGAQVYNLLQVSKWPAKVRAYVRMGSINISQALELSRKQKSEDSFVKTVEKFVEAGKKQKAPTTSILATLKKENPLFGLDKATLRKMSNEITKIIESHTGKKLAVRKAMEATNAVVAVL